MRRLSLVLTLGCLSTALAGACGGNVDDGGGSNSRSDGGAAGTAGASGPAGTGGETRAGAAGVGGAPPDCAPLGQDGCNATAGCVAILRNDILIPGAPPSPPDILPVEPGVPPECCIGCEDSSCTGCHAPRFVECRSVSACDLSAVELCGYAPGCP